MIHQAHSAVRDIHAADIIQQDAHLVGDSLQAAIDEGVRQAWKAGYLRPSIVPSPLDRRNTGDNTPADVAFIAAAAADDYGNLTGRVGPSAFGALGYAVADNVTTDSDGIIRGGSGGHSDTATGAKLAIVVATTQRGTLPIVVDQLVTTTTPGESIDALVTEQGSAVDLRHHDLADQLRAAGLPIWDIAELRAAAYSAERSRLLHTQDRVVAVVEYRDGTLIDVVQQVVAHN